VAIYQPSPESLWSLQVRQFGRERFSGLLLLRAKESTLEFVLLDPNGIRLFSEMVDEHEAISKRRALGLFKDKAFPDYLGAALSRVFLQGPSRNSCAQILHSLCWQNDETNLVKRRKWGPFTRWQVRRPLADKTISYRAPWLGVSIEFRPL